MTRNFLMKSSPQILKVVRSQDFDDLLPRPRVGLSVVFGTAVNLRFHRKIKISEYHECGVEVFGVLTRYALQKGLVEFKLVRRDVWRIDYKHERFLTV